jgi:hypothetical protein
MKGAVTMNLLHLKILPRAGTLAILLMALAAVSCSREPRKAVSLVRGKVLFGGKPTPGAVVYFHLVSPEDKTGDKLANETLLPRGKVQDDGTFQVGTYEEADGAPPGDYLISVHWLGKSKVVEEEVSLLPPKFMSPQWSGLRAKVLDGPTELPPFVLRPDPSFRGR